jgi:hypothetical protein
MNTPSVVLTEKNFFSGYSYEDEKENQKESRQVFFAGFWTPKGKRLLSLFEGFLLAQRL